MLSYVRLSDVNIIVCCFLHISQLYTFPLISIPFLIPIFTQFAVFITNYHILPGIWFVPIFHSYSGRVIVLGYVSDVNYLGYLFCFTSYFYFAHYAIFGTHYHVYHVFYFVLFLSRTPVAYRGFFYLVEIILTLKITCVSYIRKYYNVF